VSRRRVSASLALAAASVLLAACDSRGPPIWPAFGGDPGRGATLIGQAQCGACHEIPGIGDAHGLVGPPLAQFGQRTMIAGMLPNTPDSLVHWLRDPQSVTPGNGMPSTNLTEQQARDVAAYLYTLR
jgi:cytochrome c1